MAMIPQPRTTQRSDASRFAIISCSSSFLHSFTKTTRKAKFFFYLLCNSKEEVHTVNYDTKNIKGRRGLKGPRRPTEPSDLLKFEEAARLGQQPQLLSFYFHRPALDIIAENQLVMAG